MNPNFYPKPILEVPSKQPGVSREWKERGPDYLTRSDFEKLYDECGAIMHSRNPYGQPIDYGWYQQQLLPWQTKIMNLLNSHQVYLVNDPGFYIVHMKEDNDDEVHYYKFDPAPKPPTQ